MQTRALLSVDRGLRRPTFRFGVASVVRNHNVVHISTFEQILGLVTCRCTSNAMQAQTHVAAFDLESFRRKCFIPSPKMEAGRCPFQNNPSLHWALFAVHVILGENKPYMSLQTPYRTLYNPYNSSRPFWSFPRWRVQVLESAAAAETWTSNKFLP